MMPDKKRIIHVIVYILVAITFAGIVFYGGYKLGFSQTRLIRVEGVADIHPGDEITADFGVFWQAWSKIRERYLRAGDLSEQDMIYAAIKGLAENIGDSYTTFFSPDDAKKFEEDIKGAFGGIGAELEEKDGQILVVAPLKGTPAERAGIKPGDIILKAGDTDLSGKTVRDAVKIIRGEPGTVINLVILRKGSSGSREIKITREIITIPTVEWEWKDGNIAYIQVTSFSQAAPFAFYRASREIIARNPKAMILDLRNNPGGYLEVAVNLAGWFIERGEIVVKERRSEKEDTIFRSYGNAAFKDLPVVVLVNEGTASAAEIMAGAMRDVNKTKLVGGKTFGKGTVQTLEELKDGSILKITVAHWITPNGHVIEELGLVPDENVKLPEVKNNAQLNETKEDVQLNKALEMLR